MHGDEIHMSLKPRRWLPSIFVMLVIFLFSSQPSRNLPIFSWADTFVKKGGHVIGYGLLCWAFWHALVYRSNRRWFSWLLALVYAVTDEVHQAFVPGRHPSIWDVIIFDNLGAMISLWLVNKGRMQKLADPRASDRHAP